MTGPYAAPLQDSIDIDAPPARVWELVGDVCRLPQFSPQVDSTRWRSGEQPGQPGARFTNRNSAGELTWTTHGEIVRLVPEREVAFRIDENWVVWSFHLDPLDDGRTRLTQRREAPDGVSPLSVELTDAFMGGPEAFTATMVAGIRQTLAAIKAAAQT